MAATAALLRQYRPELTAAEVAQPDRRHRRSGPGAGRGGGYGAGVLNPYRAVTETGARPGRPPGRSPRSPATGPTRPCWPGRPAGRRPGTGRCWSARWIGGAAVAVVLLALVLPRGVRRRWRPAEPA